MKDFLFNKSIAVALASFSIIILPATLHAQEGEAQLAAKYEGNNAVMTNDNEKLVIDYQDGKLIADSHVEREILLISEMSAKIYNTNNVYHSYFHTVDNLEAYSLIPDKRGYRKEKSTERKTVHSDGGSVFYDDSKETMITFPSLVKGAKTFVSYDLIHRDIHFLPNFYFQSYVPIAQSTFTLVLPKSVNIQYEVRGLYKDKIKLVTTEDKKTRTYKWTATDLPQMESYEDAPGSEYYMTQLILRVTDYTAPGESSPTPVLASVNDLYHFYYKFIAKINNSDDPELKKKVNEIIAGVKTPEEKAAKIYKWVQNNIKYVAFEDGMGGFIPREASLVCNRKYGDCKDMSSLLVTMCKAAGIDAYYTWIGTRSKPYSYKETPLPIADNHMICTIKLKDQYIFLDGTDPTIPFGIPPSHIQGKEALVGINKTDFKIIKVPEVKSTANQTYDSTHLIITEKGLNGNVSISYKGYGAWRMDNILQYRNDNEKDKFFRMLTSRGSNKYMQNDFSYKTAENTTKDMSLSSSFMLPDYVKQVGKEQYINMNLQRTYENFNQDIKKRKVSVENSYMEQIKQVVVLDIPDGYKISYLPPSEEKHYDGLWGYKIAYTKSGNQIRLEKSFDINTLYINPDQFLNHNALVEGLKKQYKESVVLVKD